MKNTPNMYVDKININLNEQFLFCHHINDDGKSIQSQNNEEKRKPNKQNQNYFPNDSEREILNGAYH